MPEATEDRSKPGQGRATALAAILLAAATWLTWHAPAPPTFFNQDDFLLLDGAFRVWSDPHPLARIFAAPGIMDGAYRPLSTYLYFGAMRAAFGLNPRAFLAANVISHFGCGLLIALFLRRRGIARNPATVAAFLFLARGAFFANVHWAAAMQDNLMTLFALVALILVAEWRDGKGRGWLAAGTVAYALSLLSKESAVALVPFWLLLPWIGTHDDRRRLVRGMAVPAAAGILFLAFRVFVIGFGERVPVSLAGFRFDNLLRYPAWLVDSWMFTPPAWVGVLVLAFLVGWPLLVRRNANAEARVALTGLAWFACVLVPPLLLRDHACQYYLYLPGVGAALVVGSIVTAFARRVPRWPAVAIAAAFASFLVSVPWYTADSRNRGDITPGGFYNPANIAINQKCILAIGHREKAIPDGATVYLTGYPDSYRMEGVTWEAIARLYFGGRFTVRLEGDDPAGASADGAIRFDAAPVRFR